ncbi:MAG: hypothetical protein JSS75_07520 [Bacteroidetes bacterium]|nr:hypothetical protein [Bacteroidota bacterium]
MPRIEYYETHRLPGYDAPNERTRLLRMENAKALHLFFDVSEPYTDENLALIRQVRTSVDLPLGITVNTIPSVENLQKLFANGIYRISFRSYSDLNLLQEVTAHYPAQQLAYYYEPDATPTEVLVDLKRLGACRLIIDTPDLSDEILAHAEETVARLKLRLSVVARVLVYTDFQRIRQIAPSIDSLIFDGILEHDSFPCQKLWRIDEERAFIASGDEANLWRNPLEGVPHI